ncbi:MAG TPA: phosphohistidine phosphatase SixA [Elusimicrobia bacterium]|nr:phosphohistidine phosphatase SixA [Elusimicrobiota bacterium]HBT60349.1 phosphohistidine phosphatase SixA [Elusimicrobiota bacterium]
MKLYLLRHGQSATASEAGVARDFDRPLSPLGRDDVHRMARYLAEQGARPGVILHSPLLRAAQTAEVALSVLKPSQGLEAFAPLANELPAEDLAAELTRRGAGIAELLAVGHQPQLGELLAHLAKVPFSLRPGGVAALEIKAEGPASFLWARNPEEIPA